MMNILLLGKHGQLGWELRRILPTLGALTAIDREDLDLTSPQALRQVLREIQPRLIVNASAYTDVDRAETETALAQAVNAETPAILAEESARLGALLLHYSTDYVFDGAQTRPYLETDPVNPLNAYGRTKLQGEQAIAAQGGAFFTFRTSWVYSMRGNGFVTKILRWAGQQEVLRVVEDQTGSPTWARTLAQLSAQAALLALAHGKDWALAHSGLYHLGGEGQATRFQWAQAVLDLHPDPSQKRCHTLQPALSAEFPLPALRPSFTPLDCGLFQQTFGLRIPPWREDLRLAMDT